MIRIGRAINGISINGNEYLHDENGNELHFNNEKEGREFLIKNGINEEDLDSFQYEECLDKNTNI